MRSNTKVSFKFFDKCVENSTAAIYLEHCMHIFLESVSEQDFLNQTIYSKVKEIHFYIESSCKYFLFIRNTLLDKLQKTAYKEQRLF